MGHVKKENILDMILNSDLRSLGAIATKVVEALNMQSGSNEIERIILNDAALTAQVIKIANTSKTEGDTTRKCLHEAITRVGHEGLRSICICIGIVENIPSRNSIQRMMILDCLHRCFETATHADNLAKKISNDDSKAEYIAGLLCNVGELTFLSSPIVNLKEYVDLIEARLTPEQACLSLCGFDYDELSELIVEKWALSPLINDAFNKTPASSSGKAVKVAFELTRAFHSGRTSKAFIEVSKRLVSDFGLSLRESVVFVEKGIDSAKNEFSQYSPILQKNTSSKRGLPLKPDSNDIDQQSSKPKIMRPLDKNGQKGAINKLIMLAKRKTSPHVYYSVLADALYNYMSFERVVISGVKNREELKALAVSGTDTQNIEKLFSFKFYFGESVISEIIETKEFLYFSKNTEPKTYELVDDNIKKIAGVGGAFYLCPIIQKEAVIAMCH